MSIKSLSLASCFSLALLVAPALGANIAGNPGFEDGTGGDSDIWEEFGASSVRDSSNPNTGIYAQKLDVVGSPTAAQVSGITQNSIADNGLGSLAEGSTLSASFEYEGNLGPGAVGFAELSVLNGVGAIVASTGLIALPASTGGSYTTINAGPIVVPAFGAAPNDVYAAFININIASGAFDGSVGTAFIDDVVFDGTLAIPEPTSAALACMLGLGFVTRRRR